MSTGFEQVAAQWVVVISAIAGVCFFIVRSTVRTELADFQKQLFKDLDESYIRRGECVLMHQETGRRLQKLEDE